MNSYTFDTNLCKSSYLSYDHQQEKIMQPLKNVKYVNANYITIHKNVRILRTQSKMEKQRTNFEHSSKPICENRDKKYYFNKKNIELTKDIIQFNHL